MNNKLMYKKAYLTLEKDIFNKTIIKMMIDINNVHIGIQYVITNYIPFEVQIEDAYQNLIQQIQEYLNK